MIKFKELKQEEPYIIFKEKYDEAIKADQKQIEAISISSFNKDLEEVDSRFVNLKFVEKDKFIFFSNYNSPKSISFESFDQIAALFYWSSINVQIRMKAKIAKTSSKYNDQYFKDRTPEKNALAICSDQSSRIDSFDKLRLKYDQTVKNSNVLKCPSTWGGFSFIPYYFEFWEGHKNRLNKRVVFEKNSMIWEKYFLQP